MSIASTMSRSASACAYVLLLVVLVGVIAGSTWYESAEEARVRTAVGYYIDGTKSAERADFEKAFAVDVADMKYVRKNSETGVESLVSVPISKAIENWTQGGAGASYGRIVDVRIVDDRLAHATVELEWEGQLYVDVMSLYKVNDQWKIVNKTFVDLGRAEAKEKW